MYACTWCDLTVATALTQSCLQIACQFSYHCTSSLHTLIAIKQRYQKFFDSGAAYIQMEIKEVGPMGGDINTAYDRGYVQVLNAQRDVIIDGK